MKDIVSYVKPWRKKGTILELKSKASDVNVALKMVRERAGPNQYWNSWVDI